MREDPGIENLIDLHWQIIDQGSGYWVKFQVWRVEVSAEVPHGIRYAFLVDFFNEVDRVLTEVKQR